MNENKKKMTLAQKLSLGGIAAMGTTAVTSGIGYLHQILAQANTYQGDFEKEIAATVTAIGGAYAIKMVDKVIGKYSEDGRSPLQKINQYLNNTIGKPIKTLGLIALGTIAAINSMEYIGVSRDLERMNEYNHCLATTHSKYLDESMNGIGLAMNIVVGGLGKKIAAKQHREGKIEELLCKHSLSNGKYRELLQDYRGNPEYPIE